MRIQYDELKRTIEAAFLAAGLPSNKANLCAGVHADSSCDGVESHGLNRVPRFVEYVGKGWINTHGEPSLDMAMGAMEVYDGHQAIGITNAMFAVDRGAVLAREHGMSVIALRNTSHWMRGGTYGWYAANQGLASIMWTNTESSMPAWGAAEGCVGNNPLVISIPRAKGPLVLDMAMSQYSYGKLETTQRKGEALPYAGGYNSAGVLTTDPAAILQSRRLLPMGMWKGSGLAIMLDALAALLSQGRAGHQIDRVGRGNGTGCSQVFMFFDPRNGDQEKTLDQLVNHLQAAQPVNPNAPVRYPGQSTLERRQENKLLGVPVNDEVWSTVTGLAGF